MPHELPFIIVTNKAAKIIKTGYPWIFKTEVVGREPNLSGIVGLLDKRRKFIGYAFLSPESRYFLRVFSTSDVAIDKNFWRKRIRDAYNKRSGLAKITNAFRVVYAESDYLPSIIIDKYNDIWAIQITSGGAATIKGQLVEIIKEDYKPVAIIDKSEDHILWGEEATATVFEADQKFIVDVGSGQKTGAYLDYRDLRLKAREFAKGDCLDAFCYQGWFSCQIARCADKVVAIDSSGSAIDAAKRNTELNGHKNIEFIKADVFDYLKKCDQKFDFIHLDPPSFVTEQAKIIPAISGYKKLLSDSLRLIKPGGIIMISSCSHKITERTLEEIALEFGTIIFRGIQDTDHPLRKGFPETLYLKAVAIKI